MIMVLESSKEGAPMPLTIAVNGNYPLKDIIGFGFGEGSFSTLSLPTCAGAASTIPQFLFCLTPITKHT